jgi:hypothetical protein
MSFGETGWGPWNDPDTTRGMQALTAQGMQIAPPEAVAGLSDAELRQVADDCGALLEHVYKGTYPLAAGHADLLVDSVRQAETHLSTMRDDTGRLVGMAALVEQPNPTGGDIGFVELGRACKDPDATVSSRPLLKGRVPWAMDNLPHADYLVSSTRAAGSGNTVLPSGKGVQGVWIGGRSHGRSPLLVTGGNWRYRLQKGEGEDRIGGIEPFMHFAIPTEPEQWAKAVAGQPVHVPTEADAHMIRTMITEGTDGRVVPDVRVTPPRASHRNEGGFQRVEGPSHVTTTKYVAGAAVDRSVALDIRSVDRELYDSMGQEVAVDASTPRGASTVARLRERGWTLVGWQPSPTEYGGIWPLMARPDPHQLTELVMPGHHGGYFSASGLDKTRAILDQVYTDMLRQVPNIPRPARRRSAAA